MRFCVLLFYLLWLTACSTTPVLKARAPASLTELNPQTLINRLEPFTSDGCTKLSEAISYPFEEDWALCCVRHDVSYWKGGNKEDRQQADTNLHSCISERKHPLIADLVYYAVRAGGSDIFPTSWQWGYGWILSRGNANHSEAEKTQIQELEAQIPKNLEEVKIVPTDFIKKQKSLTGNRCIDNALTILQRDMNKTVTPTQAYHNITPTSSGFEETFKLTTQECPLPYEFVYAIKNKKDCQASNKLFGKIRLLRFEIPGSCK